MPMKVLTRSIPMLLVPWMLTGALTAFAGAPDNAAQEKDLQMLVADVGAAAVIEIDLTTRLNRIVAQNRELQVPRSVAVDLDGTLLVADERAGSVFRIDPETGKVIQAYSHQLEAPYGVAVAPSGTILVTDGGPPGTVRSIDPSTGVTTTPCPELGFENPRGIALTVDQQVVVADYGSGTGEVVRLDPAACTLTPFGSGTLRNPTGVAIDASGHFVVSDTGANKIFSIDPQSGATTVVSDSADFAGLRLLTIDSSGAILVADYVAGKVFEVDPQTGQVTRQIKGWLRQPNGVATVGGSGPPPPPPPPPPSDSSFTYSDDTYTWKISASDSKANDDPFDLAAFMNRLAYLSDEECPTEDCEVQGLVPELEARWSEIESKQATGATIAGQLDGQGRFRITSVQDY